MLLRAVAAALAVATPAFAQWDPPAGQWGKSDSADLRVMTFNIRDSICSTNNKVEGRNDWCAVARLIAAMKPDVLFLQECGDNEGNGTGSGVDSASNLELTVGMLFNGGLDSFKGNAPITAYVQKYAPGYTLPHVFVGNDTDGFNRNVIISRWPFADLNGDGLSKLSDLPLIQSDAYQPGGNGVIRGMLFAELDLPAEYQGDLVVGTSHLKSGGAQADHDERVLAGQLGAYYIDYFFNGAGTGNVDPNGKIRDLPPAQSILAPDTPVIIGGDWNEDEQTNGTKGPAEWLTAAGQIGGTDGTDRDRTDSTHDAAVDLFNGTRLTQASGSKLDYIAWQDSIVGLRRQWTFYSSNVPAGAMPPELNGFSGGAALVSSVASDHRPVLTDLVLPLADITPPPGAFELVSPANGAIHVPLEPSLDWTDSADADTYSLTIATDAGLTSVVHAAPGLASSDYAVPPGVLAECITYFWGVEAINAGGMTGSSPFSREFRTIIPADFDGNGVLNVFDFLAFQSAFSEGDPAADFAPPFGVLNVFDFLEFQNHFSNGC